MHRIWFLFVLCCLFYSTSADRNYIPVSVQEVTSQSVYFPERVRTIIPHPSDPGTLVLTNRYAVWTLSLNNMSRALIAGSPSTTASYNEGHSSSARFNGLYGSAGIGQSSVLVTDYGNHCVRTVHLFSRYTERYAGTCRSAGSNDGIRLSAKFTYPSGMAKVGSFFYINDYSNKKIRKLSGSYVSTYSSLSYYPSGLSWNGENFLYSFNHGVTDGENTTITGAHGFIDGALSSARFNYPNDVLAITAQIFLVADYNNFAVRIADLSKQMVSTLNIIHGRWSNPSSLMISSGSVYAGTNSGRIFKVPLRDIPVNNEDLNCRLHLTVPSGQCGEPALFEPNLVKSVKCINCPEVQNLTVGVYNFTYNYQTGVNYEKTCEQTVIVQDVSSFECPDDLSLTLRTDLDYINVTLQKPSSSCDWSNLRCEECPSSAKLDEGVHEINYKYRNLITERNLTCSYNIKVIKDEDTPTTDVSSFECPDDLSLTFRADVDYINVTLQKPSSSCDWSNLRCEECPSSAKLDEGVHEISYKYTNLKTERNLICSYNIKVIKDEDTPTTEKFTNTQQNANAIYIPIIGVLSVIIIICIALYCRKTRNHRRSNQSPKILLSSKMSDTHCSDMRNNEYSQKDVQTAFVTCKGGEGQPGCSNDRDQDEIMYEDMNYGGNTRKA